MAPFGPKLDTHSAITVLDQIAPVGGLAARWHSDNTYMPNPPLGSILRRWSCPRWGGDTCFANMYKAYDELSAPMRTLIDGLEAAHDLTYTLTRAIDEGLAREHLDTMQAQYPELIRPVVRVHPETGRRALFVNSNFTTRLVGVTEAESNVLLPFLLNMCAPPSSSAASAGPPTPSPSGTTAPSSTSPSPTTPAPPHAPGHRGGVGLSGCL